MIEPENLLVAKQQSSEEEQKRRQDLSGFELCCFAASLLCDQKILLLNKPETGLQ